MTRSPAPLTLAIALAFLASACGSDSGGPGDELETPRTDVPAELAGTWHHGEVSPSDFYDPHSGQWDNAYGEGMYYSFTPYGRFEWGYRLDTSSYGCSDAAMFWRTGTVAVDPLSSSFTLYPHRAILHSQSDCHSEWNYTKQIPRDPETISWQFGDDGYGTPALLLSYGNSGASAFYPWHLAGARQ